VLKVDLKKSKDWQMDNDISIVDEIIALSPELKLLAVTAVENIVDDISTFWVDKNQLLQLMQVVRHELNHPFAMCFDLTAIDETERQHKAAHLQDFTISYHLRSHERNSDIRIKVSLSSTDKQLESVCSLWANANWYEREVWDMFSQNGPRYSAPI